MDEALVQRTVREAVVRAGLTKLATCRTLRHSFATRLLEAGYDVPTVQELPGHRDVKTTMLFTHVLSRGPAGVHSPADGLEGRTLRRPALYEPHRPPLWTGTSVWTCRRG